MAAGISVAIGLGATACSRDYVADYVYTVSASGPNINAFAVDFQSGILTQVTGSPFTTGFQRETTLVPSPDGKFLYVLSGSEDSAVEVFAVGTDGKLYGAEDLHPRRRNLSHLDGGRLRGQVPLRHLHLPARLHPGLPRPRRRHYLPHQQ